MGTWGTGIFADDLARDVRDTWRDLVGNGLSPAEATARLLVEYADVVGGDDRVVFWAALALTEHRVGHLEPRVQAEALLGLTSGADLLRWEDPHLRRRRAKVLEGVQRELEMPPPAPRRIAARFRNTCDWQVGEIIAYRLRSGGWAAFRVTGHHTDRGGTSPILEVLDYQSAVLADADELCRAGVRQDIREDWDPSIRIKQFMVGGTSAREMPRARLHRLNLASAPSSPRTRYTVVLWRRLDAFLEQHFGLS